MAKQKRKSVSMTRTSYALLGELAEGDESSRSALVEKLIRAESDRRAAKLVQNPESEPPVTPRTPQPTVSCTETWESMLALKERAFA